MEGGHMMNKMLAGAWVWLVILALAGCVQNPATRKTMFNIFSWDEEIKLGREAMADNAKALQKAGAPVQRGGEKSAGIDRVVRRIAAVSDMPDLPYQATVFVTNVANAAAFPGGPIMVFSGLWDPKTGFVSDEDELAAVLAHEIAHVNCRHSTTTMSAYMTAGLAAQVAAEVARAKDRQNLADILQGGFLVTSTLIMPRYSRVQEEEADRVGLMYMAKAGYDPRAAPRMWRRVAEKERAQGGGGGGVLSWFSTHPDAERRATYLQESMPPALAAYEQSRRRM